MSTSRSFLDEAPLIGITGYSPAKLVKVSNALIKLGKIEGLKTLREYIKYRDKKEGVMMYDDSAVYLICQMIFKPRKDKAFLPLQLGGTSLTREEEKSFPNFPLLISNGVPFLVINGYIVNGFGYPSIYYLDKCEKEMDYRTEINENKDVKAASAIAIKEVDENKKLSDWAKKEIKAVILYQIKKSGALLKNESTPIENSRRSLKSYQSEVHQE